MKQILGLVMMSALLIGVGRYALGSDNPLPAGVSSDNWIALGDRAGFVVTNGDALIGAASSVGVARGYFMLRRGGVWLRIDTAANDGGAAMGR